jgi:hypothetical protein
MLGYPRRHQPIDRAARVATLFDPTVDSSCTGWWRADDRLNISDVSRGLATGIRSRLADQKPMINAGSPPWLIVPDASNGFPGLFPQNEGWMANGIAVSGDRYMTATWVIRFVSYRANYQENFCGVSGMCTFGFWDSWIRVYHPNVGFVTWIDGQWFPWNAANISVLTMRVKPVDEAAGNLIGQFRFNWNSQALGPFNQNSDWGDRVMSDATTIGMYGSNKGPMLFHEAIFFRRHLSDSEVVSMHNLLLLQYGQA